MISRCFVPSLVEIVHVVPEKKVFECRQCIFTISFLSPLGKVEDPLFGIKPQNESSLPAMLYAN